MQKHILEININQHTESEHLIHFKSIFYKSENNHWLIRVFRKLNPNKYFFSTQQSFGRKNYMGNQKNIILRIFRPFTKRLSKFKQALKPPIVSRSAILVQCSMYSS